MKGVAGLALLLANVHLCRPCIREKTILICKSVPSDFDPGFSTLVINAENVGEINSTVFHSDNLSSITRLTFTNAGVTGIAEAAFSSFRALTDLILDKNMLSQVDPNWLGEPSVLRELILSENQIEVVNESMLNGLSNLTVLRLNRNGIKHIYPQSFSSQTVLAELDLSNNWLAWVSPEVFRSLKSTLIRLDGNPWDCSCAAEDFVVFLRDLQNRSLLDRQMDVTCESPPSLKGQPVWNVTVCVPSPSPGPSPATQTVHPRPTDALTSSATVVTTPPSRPTSKTEASGQPKPTDAPVTVSPHTATLSSSETSVRPEPTDILPTVTTAALQTGTSVTSPLSGTDTSIHPKPTNLPITAFKPTVATESPPPQPPSNIVCTLIVVIVILCALLFVVCFLAAQCRRKRNSKTVMPGRQEEDNKKLEDDSRSSLDPSPGPSEDGDPEVARRRSFTGVRAKSANAIILTSAFSVSGVDQVTSQTETETQSKDEGNPAEGKQLGNETGAAAAGVESQTRELTNTTDMVVKSEKQADVGRNPDGNTDMVPYLSIGTNQNRHCPGQESNDGPGQRSQMRKVLGRTSTWPPTAVQWQARCKMKEEEEEGDGSTVWTQNVTEKFSGEVRKTVNKLEAHPSRSDREPEPHMNLRLSQSLKPNDKTPSVRETHTHTDSMQGEQLKEDGMIQGPATVGPMTNETQNLKQEKQNQGLKPAESPAHRSNKSGSKADLSKGPRQAVTGGPRAENTVARSKASSGGTSPDDETLLSGNQYAAMDLLHEVAQNNGRWTRKRWKQMHANTQRR